jgi:hypothetical protein
MKEAYIPFHGGCHDNPGRLTMRRITCLLISLYLLSGCVTSKITASRDPAFATKQFASIVVFAQGMAQSANVEFEQEICGKLAPTPCRPGKSVLPDTRNYSHYTADEVEKYVKATGADAILVIARVADQSDTRYFGTKADLSSSASATAGGSINFYRNPAFWGGAAAGPSLGPPASTPEYNYSAVAFGQLGLFDRQSGDIAWQGEILVGGHGRDSMTTEAFIGSATSEIVRELRAAGLVK